MKSVTIYTDGSCKRNPGPGGWAAILVYGEREKELSGGERDTTNNRMELTAAIEGMAALREPCKVELWSDSKYLIDSMTKGWVVAWRSRGWRKADKAEALNSDLWQRILELCATHEVTFRWVRGHNGHSYNERCDELAQAQAEAHR